MATVKTCFKCKADKPLTDFYNHPQMRDGHLNKCKECAKKDAYEHRLANDSVREYDKARAQLPHRKENRNRVVRLWQRQHPERRAAAEAVGRAIRSGKLQRLPCWVCGAKAVAHHPDYSSPLDVIWLCQLHHKRAHAIAGKTK